MWHLLEVSVLVFAIGLQDDSDNGHERFDHTELQRGLLTEPQQAYGVSLSFQTAGPVHTARPGGTEKFTRLTYQCGSKCRKTCKIIGTINASSLFQRRLEMTV